MLAMIAAWTAILALVAVRYRPPAVALADAPMDTFSGARAFTALEALLDGIGPHPTGSEANARVRDRVVAALEAHGWETELQSAESCGRHGRCASIVNVIARRPGASRATAIALTAHYDSVPAGPGASDDGAGVASLIEIARVASHEDLSGQRELVLLVTDGEELGLLGARAFVREHPLAERVHAVINLEARGTSGPSILFRASDGALVRAFAERAPRPITNSVADTVFSLLPNDTDLSVFLEAGRRGIDLAFIGDPLRYHTPEDDLEHLDRQSLQHHGDNALAAARALVDAPAASGADAVWTDVLALFVIAIDLAWMRALCVLALAIVLAVAVSRRRHLSAGALSRGAGGVVLALVVAFVAGWVTALATQPEAPWASEPAPWVIGASIIGALAFALASFLARRVTAEELALGATALLSAGAIALAWTLPGTSYVLGLPALVSSVVLAPVVLGARTARLAAGASATVSALLLFPFGPLLYDALGHVALGPIAAVFALALVPALPLASTTRHR